MEAKQYLNDLAKRLAARLRVRPFLRLGDPVTEIVAAAASEKADLIAMATHGAGGLGRAMFGSVAEAVLRTAPVKVVLS